MPFPGKRSSRDDKSKKSTRTPLDRQSKSDKQGFDKSDRPMGNRKSFGDKSFKSERPAEDRKPFGDKPFKSDRPAKDRKSFGDKPFKSDRPARDRKSFGDKPFKSDRPTRDQKSFGDKPFKNDRPARDRKPFGDKPFRSERPARDRKPFGDKSFKSDRPTGDRKSFGDKSSRSNQFSKRSSHDHGNWDSVEHFKSNIRPRKPKKENSGLIRLNRYIANAGICSRRKADELIAAGVVSVNGEAVTELGLKVDPAKDIIRYNGETLKREKMVYVLLNKPKDYITTTDDPQERKTVMSLVEKSSNERIYPVGRLDRNTTGLLLMTNDGDLAEKLSHPRNQVTKIYQVELNKNLTQGDFNKISFGVELEDGVIKPDAVSYVNGGGKNEIGIQIHSGKNRIVRRIFEHLGYEVIKLDRVVYANLTKKDLPRGHWRYIDEKEIIQLKHLMQIVSK